MKGLDYFRKKIQELELKSPVDKNNFYREHTDFLLKKMGTVQILDSENKVVEPSVFFANPERAIAKMKEDRNLTLPVITVAIGDIDEDLDRRRSNFNLDIETVWNPKNRIASRVVSTVSKAVNITFTINIWAKYVEDINQIVENILLMFNPSLDITTSRSNNSKAFIAQVTDNSVITVADKADRVVRKLIVVSVESYLPNKKYLVTSNGSLKLIGLDFEFIDDKASNFQTQNSVGDSNNAGEEGNVVIARPHVPEVPAEAEPESLGG